MLGCVLTSGSVAVAWHLDLRAGRGTQRRHHRDRVTVKRRVRAMAAAQRSVRVAIIGDVHGLWSPEQDHAALEFLKPDLVLFVGDFGEEDVQLVEKISKCPLPHAVILGNHDAWCSMWNPSNAPPEEAHKGVIEQLAILGADHVGFGSKGFPECGVSVVGARPFSWGASTFDRPRGAARFYQIRYGVGSMEESAQRICDTVRECPEEHALIVISHSGPEGLGARPEDPCGKDFSANPGGDFGDPDLRDALEKIRAGSGEGLLPRRCPLVAFGHMHRHLDTGGRRYMVALEGPGGQVWRPGKWGEGGIVHVDASDVVGGVGGAAVEGEGFDEEEEPEVVTVYVNAAEVPRVRGMHENEWWPVERSPGNPVLGAEDLARLGLSAVSEEWLAERAQVCESRHFTMVEMAGGEVDEVWGCWVVVSQERDVGGVIDSEQFFRRSRPKGGSGRGHPLATL